MGHAAMYSQILLGSFQTVLCLTSLAMGVPILVPHPPLIPHYRKITLRIPHASREPASFPRTARKEAPSLAISWWQQAACHVPHPTSHVPCPTSPLQGLGHRCAMGCQGPAAPICTRHQSGPPCSSQSKRDPAPAVSVGLHLRNQGTDLAAAPLCGVAYAQGSVVPQKFPLTLTGDAPGD